MGKATIGSLNELHDLVAKQLKNNLDDPKVLAQAITFLKNNNITVDLQESKDVQDIFTVVNKMVTKKPKEETSRDPVELLLEEIA